MTAGFSSLPGNSPDDESGAQFRGTARVRGPAWARLPAITLGLLGVQIFWSVEMSYASPYLLSLGLTKPYMALVFVAGPLSGLIVQPLVGLLADASRSRFGRRRPYIAIGGALCVGAMLLLGFTGFFAGWFTTEGSSANRTLTIWLAVLSIYFIDFSINAVQAMDRALLVDTLPTSQQAPGNAWAARMLGIGSVLGFLFGAMDLETWFPLLGNTELQILSVIGCLAFVGTHAVTILCVEEKVLVSSNGPKRTFAQEMRDILTNMKTLPHDIRQICLIQFFAWIGWFPVIFYTTTYIGYLHKSNVLKTSVTPSNETLEDMNEEGTRLGTKAMLFNAILSLICNILLPFLIAESGSGSGESTKSRIGSRGLMGKMIGAGKRWCTMNLATLWALSHLVFAGCMGATLFINSVTGTTILVTLVGFSWAVTQWAPFSLLAEAILTSSSPSATNRNSIMLGDIRTRRSGDEEHRGLLSHENDEHENAQTPMQTTGSPPQSRRRGNSNTSDSSASDTEEPRPGTQSSGSASRLGIMSNHDAQVSVLDVGSWNQDRERLALPESESENGGPGAASPRGGLSGKAGIILGIHNIFIVIPQFLVTGLSSIIFAFMDMQASVVHRDRSSPGIPNESGDAAEPSAVELAMRDLQADAASGASAVGLILRIGGVSAAVAFVLCWRLAKEHRRR